MKTKLILMLLVGIFLPSLMALAEGQLTLVQNEKTAYVIYYDKAAPQSVQIAAQDLQKYFSKSADVTPKIVVEDAAPQAPFISLGNTAAARIAGLDATKIPQDGFRIVARGNNLFIIGQDTPDGGETALGGVSDATANGIYTFCEKYLGIQWFMPGDIGENIPHHDSIKIPADLDHTEIPDFVYRRLAYIGESEKDVLDWMQQMKVAKYSQVSRGSFSDSWTQTIPASLFDKHPDWFAEINGKRQYPTGRYKLETTNPELVQAYADTIIAAFSADPKLKWYSLSPVDGGGFSESAASKAFYDKDPNGDLSVTPLILKFYNDVAQIVGKKFPDRHLGGYLYSNYLYPPSSGIGHIEPNLTFQVAGGLSAAYQLYRPDVQKQWNEVVQGWGEAVKKSGGDIYSYDMPTYFKQSKGVITPPAPEILNFVFSRLAKYGYEGDYIYGVDGWEQSGPANYAKARLLWNPHLDAVELCREYYRGMYGDAAAPHMEQLYDILDAAFKIFYNKHHDASYNLTPDFLTEIYAPHYTELEQCFLAAQAAATTPKEKQRLHLFGDILAVMQWNLKANKALPADFKSPMTMTDDNIDAAIRELHWDVADGEMTPETVKYRAEPATKLTDNSAPAAVPIPTRTDIRMLLYAPQTGDITVDTKTLESRGELVRYIFYDASTNAELAAGVLRAGRILRFPAQAGKTYRLDVINVWSSFALEVHGAITAYKTNALHRGFRIDAYDLAQEETPLTFYVPAGTKGFNVVINGAGVAADIVSPDGKMMGTIDTKSTSVARVKISQSDSMEGYWKLVLKKPTSGNPTIYIALDSKLPQWFSTDPAHPLHITELH